jgi:hypothetical protein
MPVRKVSNRGGNIIGKFPSLKLKRMVAFESTIERDLLYLLDYEADISFFEEQPLVIKYQHGNKVLGYTPDFHIIRSGQNVLVECKPVALIGTDDNLRKFDAARKFCITRGWKFRICTDQELRLGSRLENVKLLTRYACHAIKPEMKGWVYTLLQGTVSPLSIGHIQALTSTLPSIVLACLLHMAYRHELFIPLNDGLISTRSLVYLSRQISSGEDV